MVSIRTQYTGGDAEHPASVEYRIMVPRGANLENVKLINGGLSLSGMAGPVKASSRERQHQGGEDGGQGGTFHGERFPGGRLPADPQVQPDFAEFGERADQGCRCLRAPARNVSAHNLSGGIDADFGRSWRAPGGHRLEAAVNGGGTQIRVHNVNGGISIHSNWSRRSVHPAS